MVAGINRTAIKTVILQGSKLPDPFTCDSAGRPDVAHIDYSPELLEDWVGRTITITAVRIPDRPTENGYYSPEIDYVEVKG